MGILDKIKNIFVNATENTNMTEETIQDFDKIIQETHDEYAALPSHYFYEIKVEKLNVCKDIVMQWADKKKIDFILYLVQKIDLFYKNDLSNNNDYENNQTHVSYINCLLKSKIQLDENDIDRIYSAFISGSSNFKKFAYRHKEILMWPVNFLNQIERQYGNIELSTELKTVLSALKRDIEKSKIYDDSKIKPKLIERINDLLNAGKENYVKEVTFLGNDKLKKYANETVAALPENEKRVWYQFFVLANKETGSKPTAKFLRETKTLINELGEDKFKKFIIDLFNFVIKHIKEGYGDGYASRDYDEINFIEGINADCLRGFVWACINIPDKEILNNVTNFAERCYRKIYGIGAALPSVGNACFYTLFKSEGMMGIGMLSVLKLRIKQNSAQKILEKYQQEAVKEKGVSIYEIEDLSLHLQNSHWQHKYTNGTDTTITSQINRKQ